MRRTDRRGDAEPQSDLTADPLVDGFDAGTNVLVTDGAGGDRGALSFALERLADGPGPVSVVSTDTPPEAVASAATTGPSRPRIRIVDCRNRASEAAADGATGGCSTTPTGTRVRSAPEDLPAVGEATVAELDGERGPAAVGLCLDSVSTLVNRDSVQGVYKLLYVLANRVRSRGALAFYVWNGASEVKTVRILSRALDYRLSLGEPTGPSLQRLPCRGGDE
jgi:hypothetical protein